MKKKILIFSIIMFIFSLVNAEFTLGHSWAEIDANIFYVDTLSTKVLWTGSLLRIVNDLVIEEDKLYLGTPGVENRDIWFYIRDDDVDEAHYLKWDDGDSDFQFSDNTKINGDLSATGKISGATYGSDGSITDAELLFINTLGSNAQNQLDARCLESVFGTAIGTGLLLDSATLKASTGLQSLSGLSLSAGDMAVATGANAWNVMSAGSTTDILVGGGAANPVWTASTGTGAPVRASSPIFSNNAGAATFGAVATDADVVINFAAVTNQGTMTYMEDEDRLDISMDFKTTGNVAGTTYGSDGSITDAELLFINTLGSNAQTQLNGKAATDQALDTFGVTTDITTLDASTTKHGLMMKYPGGSTNFLREDGTWVEPSGGGLTQEEVDDYVYALINDAQSVHTGITITYDDTDDAYDFVVDAETDPNALLTAGTDNVNDTHINWGTSTNEVSAVDVPIADAGVIITATEVEGALQENRTAIDLNTVKDTNVPTELSAGTVNATTYGITSDGGTDDIVLPEATTTVAGLLGADKWDEIVANSLKVTDDDIGVAEAFAATWDTKTESPQKNDIYDQLHLIDTNDDGDVDNIDATLWATKANTDQALDTFGATTDITTLDASTTKHGLMMKYPGGTTTFLREDGTWVSPGGSGWAEKIEVNDTNIEIFDSGASSYIDIDIDGVNVIDILANDYRFNGEGNVIYLDYGSIGVETHDINIYFGDDAVNTAHLIGWDDSESEFDISDDTNITGNIAATTYGSTGEISDAELLTFDDLVSNVTTDLSIGTITSTTMDVNSSDGNNATLISATTTDAGILTASKWDEIVANSLKVTDDDIGVAEAFAATWDTKTDSPQKNDIYDQLHLMDTDDDGDIDNIDATVWATKANTDQALDTFGATTDITTLDASTSKHGLMMKYPGGTTTFLREDGTWVSPGGTGWAEKIEVNDTNVEIIDVGASSNIEFDIDGSNVLDIYENEYRFIGEANVIYLDYGSAGAETHDINIYFGDDAVNTAHLIGWDDSESEFDISDDTNITGNIAATTYGSTGEISDAELLTFDDLVSNVSTDLSIGTITSTTMDVNSSDGNNATLISATTSDAGILTAAKWDEIVANSLKETDDDVGVAEAFAAAWDTKTESPQKNDVYDQLHLMDTDDDGDIDNIDATYLASAETDPNALLTAGTDNVNDTHINWGTSTNEVSAVDVPIADAGTKITATEVEGALQENRTAIDLNTAKDTNVSTNLSEGTSTETTVDVNSSDGDNATLVSASTSRAGLLTKAKWDEIVANSLKETDDDVGVAEAFAAAWDTKTDSPQKNDIYDQLHLMDTDDDGDIDNIEATLWDDKVDLLMDAEPTSDHAATGRILDMFNAGEAIGQFVPVYSDATDSGELKICDSDVDKACIGITYETGSDGVGCAIVTDGLLRDDTWTWTPGKDIWASSTGTLTETKETTSGNFVIYVGYAVTDDCMYVDPCPVTVGVP